MATIKKPNDEEDLFAIDPDNLDKDWVDHPRRYFRAARKLVEAKDAYDRAKARVEFVVADLSMAIRSDPASYDLPKVTEDGVEKTILLQKQYQEAQKHLLSAKHEVEERQAVINALDHKKKALENMVQLALANYYSRPRAPKGAQEDLADKARSDFYDRRKGKEE